MNGVDPLGLETRGLGPSIGISGFGWTGEVGASYVTDEDGNHGLELYNSKGASSDWGASININVEETTADTIKQLEGKTDKVGGSGAVPVSPMISVSAGADALKGQGYIGKSVSGGIGISTVPIPIEVHAKRENSIVFDNPLQSFGDLYDKQIQKRQQERKLHKNLFR